MKKLWRQKIWSLGTNLGYLGPVSQKGLHQILFTVLWSFRTHMNALYPWQAGVRPKFLFDFPPDVIYIDVNAMYKYVSKSSV